MKLIILNLKQYKNHSEKKKKKKFMTILKSPHVNKTAQEQFEIRTFSMQLKVVTMQPFKFLMLLKKMKNYLFPDISVKLKLIFSPAKNISLKKKFFNMDNFKIQQAKIFKNQKSKNKKIMFSSSKNFLQLFDVYGM